MLPQKKNADITDLTRGKAERLIGDLTGLLTTLKGLPLSYNRDLQEDKELLFDSYDHLSLAIGALSGMIATTRFNTDQMRLVADSELLAPTDVAEWLVQRGMPFRGSYAKVGGLVQVAISGTKSLRDLVAADPELGHDAATLIASGVGVTRRSSPGAADPAAAQQQLARYAKVVANLRELLAQS